MSAKLRPVSKPFYLGSIAVGMACGVALPFCGAGDPVGLLASPARLLQAAPLLVILAYGQIVALVLLYRMWAAIQPASTTPGRAVGFLFVPLLNMYWAFRAFRGWAAEFGRLAQARGLSAPKPPDSAGLAISVIVLLKLLLAPLALAPGPAWLRDAGRWTLALSMPVMTWAYLVFGLMFFSAGCTAINALSGQDEPSQPVDKPG